MLQQALLWISPINIILKVNFVKLSILPLRTLLEYGIIICTSYLLLLLLFYMKPVFFIYFIVFLWINIEEYYLESLYSLAIKIVYLSSVTVLYKITELPYTLTRSKLKHRNKILLHFTTTNEGWV